MAQLKTTVFVQDPDTRQTVELHPGTCPEPRLAALVTNPVAWVDGKLPRLRLAQKPEQHPEEQQEPKPAVVGDDEPGDAPAEDSEPGSVDDSSPAAEEEKPPTRAAKKTAGRKPARTAAEGTGGQ
ncbi:hypothetical protein [Streptomyces sp. NPDC059071]|uniref:hypothetical protein n=1 Tax=unclassified Streptomyces TaxID=2593676 RepID=UPI003652C84D